MGIFADLLGKTRRLKVDDEFFGHLTYMRMPKGRTSYWEAKRIFSPTGRNIELFIDAPAPEQGPNESQRDFFRTVERSYSAICASVDAVVRPQFEAWTGGPLRAAFEREFTMTSFSIPLSAFEEAEWEMSFESQTDEKHLFTVTLRAATAVGVSIDG